MGNCRFEHGMLIRLEDVSYSSFDGLTFQFIGDVEGEAAIQIGLEERCDHLHVGPLVGIAEDLDHWVEMGPSGSGNLGPTRLRGHDGETIVDPDDNLDTFEIN